MNFTCSICTELFVPSSDVSFTPCGHFFHFMCVTHWLERSKTCPQCRNKVTNKTLQRAYFNFASTNFSKEDNALLESKIDSLNFKILLKDKDIKTYGEENVTLKKQCQGLRAFVKTLESEIVEKRSAIHALQVQLKYFTELTADREKTKKEVDRLKKCLDQYKNVETLLSGSQADVDRMLRDTTDPVTLTTHVSIMKREMERSVHRSREMRDRIRRLEQELIKVKAEKNKLLESEARCRQLEEDLHHCENEKRSLMLKLDEIESLSSKTNINREHMQRYIAESPAPNRLNSLAKRVIIPATPDSDATPPKIRRMSSDKEESPYEHLKSRGSYNLPTNDLEVASAQFRGSTSSLSSLANELTLESVNAPKNSKTRRTDNNGVGGNSTTDIPSSRVRPASTSLSIMNKKPRLESLKGSKESAEMYFDGFGGHSKVDLYPSPILNFKPKVLKKNLMSVKVRRKNTDANNKKLHDFFIDLT